MKDHITPLASLPLYTCEDLYFLSDKEKQSLADLEYKIVDSGGGNFVTKNRQILDLAEFANLKSLMLKQLMHFITTGLQITDEFVITDSWATQNPPGTFHEVHKHSNSIFSGVYYADIEAGGGDIEFSFESQFDKTFAINYNLSGYNLFNSRSWTIGPKKGMMLIFPSWVHHRVGVNQSTRDRRIIGFNAFVRGKFGSDAKIDNLSINIG